MYEFFNTSGKSNVIFLHANLFVIKNKINKK